MYFVFFLDFHASRVNEYRIELVKHVESGFRQNLVSYCSSSLIEDVKHEKSQMIYQLTNVIKDKGKTISHIIAGRLCLVENFNSCSQLTSRAALNLNTT